jgi:hypothetical protein
MRNFGAENILEEEGGNVKMILIRVMELGCDNGRKRSLAQDQVQYQHWPCEFDFQEEIS